MSIKQVIVIRKDLNMRRGKECAQSAHASSLFLMKKFHNQNFELNEIENQWMNGLFTKTVVSVDSEEELDIIYNKAKDEGLEVNLVIDSGKTEFNGVATKTCLAIGPDEAEKIDKITGHLRLR